jgi:hypothetical protein
MKYILIMISKKIQNKSTCPQNGTIFHVSMWWVVKNKIKVYMLILNMFIYKSFYKKKKKTSSRCHCCSNVWNRDIQMHFWSNYLIYLVNFSYRCVDHCKIFKNEMYLFSFRQSTKKIIIVKIGYFCMGQRMMWNSVVNFTYIFCQQVELCKLYKHMKKY